MGYLPSLSVVAVDVHSVSQFNMAEAGLTVVGAMGVACGIAVLQRAVINERNVENIGTVADAAAWAVLHDNSTGCPTKSTSCPASPSGT